MRSYGEIQKALELCTGAGDPYCCAKCPYSLDCKLEEQNIQLLRDSLIAMNRFQVLREMTKYEDEDGWIPCERQMPEKNTGGLLFVIRLVSGQTADLGRWDGVKWITDCGVAWSAAEVTHWRDFPRLPKGVEA